MLYLFYFYMLIFLDIFLSLIHSLLLQNIHIYLSSPKPRHTTGGSVRRGARRTTGRGRAGQNREPTFRSAREATVPLALQGTMNNCSERLFAITNKGNPM